MSIDDDKAFVKKFLKTRSEKAFRQLYRQHSQNLFRLAIHLTDGDKTASEDILQEMWTRAIYHLTEFRWQSELRTWLSGILINCCREHNRKQLISTTSLDDLENLLDVSQKSGDKIDLK